MNSADFYTKAAHRLNIGVPVESIYELAATYGITKESAEAWVEARIKQKAEKSAKETGQEEIYNMLDSIIANGNPNLVVYHRGDNNEFYEYRDGVYVYLSKRDMRDLVDGAMAENDLQAHRANRRKVIDTVDRLSSTLTRLDRVYTDEMVQRQKWQINLKNGLLDPETRTLTPHTPDYFSTAQVPFEYDPSAKIDVFKSFLDTVSEGDVGQQEMLQEMYGYCLGDGNPRHKVFYLYGATARNGKSTVAKVLMGLIGETNCSSLSLAQLSNDGNRALQGLIGKQINFSDEVSTKYIESALLTSLSAEGKVHIDPKYKDSFDYTVHANFIIACNDMPRFESSQGMLKRMVIIPFNHYFTDSERILRYEEKLLKENGSGILNWALDGLARVRDNCEFTLNEQSIEDLHNAQKESVPVIAYLEETYEFTKNENDILPSAFLYGTPRVHGGKDTVELPTGYFEYCEKAGIKPMSRMKFLKEVARFADSTKKIEKDRVKDDDGKNATRGYKYIKTKGDSKSYDEHF